MEATEPDYDDLGITPRQIDAILDHNPLSHDILETLEDAEAKYQPLTVSVPPPTVLSLSRSSPGYAVEFAHHLPDVAAFAEYVDIEQGESVLDLGTGLGWVLTQLRQVQIKLHSRRSGPFQPPTFVGVDASQSMVNLAHNLAQSQRRSFGDFRFVRDDMVTLQGMTNRFDIITCRWAFQHLPSSRRQAALARWKSLLAPGGRIVFDFQGDTPIPCTMDVLHAGMRHPGSGAIHPTRGYVVPDEELEERETAFKALLAAAKLKLVIGKPIKIAGINNHDQALCRVDHFASTGGGYDDLIEGARLLWNIFSGFVGREPNQTERSLLTLHYMMWVQDQATACQPGGSGGPAAMLYTNNLALVAVVQPEEE